MVDDGALWLERIGSRLDGLLAQVDGALEARRVEAEHIGLADLSVELAIVRGSGKQQMGTLLAGTESHLAEQMQIGLADGETFGSMLEFDQGAIPILPYHPSDRMQVDHHTAVYLRKVLRWQPRHQFLE